MGGKREGVPPPRLAVRMNSITNDVKPFESYSSGQKLIIIRQQRQGDISKKGRVKTPLKFCCRSRFFSSFPSSRVSSSNTPKLLGDGQVSCWAGKGQ